MTNFLLTLPNQTFSTPIVPNKVFTQHFLYSLRQELKKHLIGFRYINARSNGFSFMMGNIQVNISAEVFQSFKYNAELMYTANYFVVHHNSLSTVVNNHINAFNSFNPLPYELEYIKSPKFAQSNCGYYTYSEFLLTQSNHALNDTLLNKLILQISSILNTNAVILHIQINISSFSTIPAYA